MPDQLGEPFASLANGKLHNQTVQDCTNRIKSGGNLANLLQVWTPYMKAMKLPKDLHSLLGVAESADAQTIGVHQEKATGCNVGFSQECRARDARIEYQSTVHENY